MCARLAEFFLSHSLGSLWKARNRNTGGVGFVEWKNILFAFDQISFCVERVALRLRLVLPVVVFIT